MSIMSTGLGDDERRNTSTTPKTGSATTHKPLTITVATACAMSGLGPSKIWNLIREGKLPVTRFGHRTLVHFAPFEELVLAVGGVKRKTPSKRRADTTAASEASTEAPTAA
jgi:excisionase family DNA binding protein